MIQEPHPLDVAKETATLTPPAQLKAELSALTQQQLTLAASFGWSAAAEDTFRKVIGMERKAQLEMRVALGEAGKKYLRYSPPLADMTLPELQADYAETRRVTLELLDELLVTPGVKAWTLGEEVPAHIYLAALLGRLTRLGAGLAQEKV